MYTQFFGNYLLSNGYVTQEQLFSAMQRQADNHLKLGTLAIHAGYMNASEVDDTVIHQTHQDRKFGELAVELGCQPEILNLHTVSKIISILPLVHGLVNITLKFLLLGPEK